MVLVLRAALQQDLTEYALATTVPQQQVSAAEPRLEVSASAFDCNCILPATECVFFRLRQKPLAYIRANHFGTAAPSCGHTVRDRRKSPSRRRGRQNSLGPAM